MRTLRTIAAAAAACLLSLLAGCGPGRNGGVGVDMVTARRQVDARTTVQPLDQSGPLAMNDVQAPGGTRGGAAAQPPDVISPTVEQSVRPVEEEGFQGAGPAPASPRDVQAPPREAPPAPPPATARAGPLDAPDTTGGFQLVGTVLAEVHDTPIFADKVLASVDKVLAAQAARLEEREFRRVAAEAIDNQIKVFVRNELEFAMAKRRLDARDQEMARLLTIRWREDQIARAGGSPEVARQRAAAAGYDFDELGDDQFRWNMRKLYYQKYEYPKIHVSADDMRRYYQEHRQKEFTSVEHARFRVIKVDKRKTGGRDEALGEARRLLDRVKGGKDFAELAAEDNDEEAFKRPPPEPFTRGSFVVKEVEDAVWNLSPGQVTDVIETPDAFFIAKLEEKQPGGVRPFEDPDVQREIEAVLKSRQFGELQESVRQSLMRDAIIRYHPRMIELAVGMAMQKYRYWREAAAAR
jgi:parvulin-like peptidyl-prolyl isomerase